MKYLKAVFVDTNGKQWTNDFNHVVTSNSGLNEVLESFMQLLKDDEIDMSDIIKVKIVNENKSVIFEIKTFNNK